MKKLFVFLATILFISILDVKATEVSPYHFLRTASNARAAALSGCYVSMPGDPAAVVFNPATIYTVEEKKFSATFLKHVLDINSGMVTYTREFEGTGIFSGTINYTNYGSFERADMYGNIDGTFGANDISLGVSYADELDTNLFYGVTGKFIFITLEEANSTAFAIDAGLLYRMPDGRTHIGLSVLHAGTQLSKVGGMSEKLPLDIRAGFNHRLRGLPLLFNFSFHHLGDEEDNFFDKFMNFSVGGEFYIGEYIQARLGYDNQIRRLTSIQSDRKMSGFSGGVGIKANKFNIDYAISMMGSSASLHRFSVALNL